MRADRWRILVGEDAKVLDAIVRRDPENAYEPSFIREVQAAGHFGGIPSGEAS